MNILEERIETTRQQRELTAAKNRIYKGMIVSFPKAVRSRTRQAGERILVGGGV